MRAALLLLASCISPVSTNPSGMPVPDAKTIAQDAASPVISTKLICDHSATVQGGTITWAQSSAVKPGDDFWVVIGYHTWTPPAPDPLYSWNRGGLFNESGDLVVPCNSAIVSIELRR